MKKSLYSAVAAALVLGAASLPSFAQNVAVVNGKAVPVCTAVTFIYSQK